MHTGETINELTGMVVNAEAVARMESEMEVNDRVKHLDDARQMLRELMYAVASGPAYPYHVLLSAHDYIDAQITEAFKKYFSQED
jgi:hypothetical protein